MNGLYEIVLAAIDTLVFIDLRAHMHTINCIYIHNYTYTVCETRKLLSFFSPVNLVFFLFSAAKAPFQRGFASTKIENTGVLYYLRAEAR